MCFYDDGDGAEFASCSYPVARKEHECYECDRTIAPGEQYAKLDGKWNGEMDTFKFCADCDRLREAVSRHEIEVEKCRYGESWCPFGELLGYLNGHGEYGSDGVGDTVAVAIFERALGLAWPPVREVAA